MDRGKRIETAQAGLDHTQILLGHQIGLVQDNLVGKGNLFAGLAAVGKAKEHMFGVNHRGDTIELGARLDVLIDKEGLGHRPRIGQACGFNNDGVKAALALHQARQDPDQVAAHRAANAAIVHLKDLFVGTDDQVIIDTDLAKLIDDHRITLAVILREDAVEQGGLTGAEIAGQNGNGGL